MLRGGDLTTHMDGYNEAHNETYALSHDIDDEMNDIELQRLVSRTTATQALPVNSQDTVKRVWGLASPERRLWILSLITLVVTSGVQLLVPLTAGKVIDRALRVDSAIQDHDSQHDTDPSLAESPSKSTSELLMILFGVMSLAAYLTYLRTIWQAQAANQLVARLRQLLYKAILSKEAAFFDSHTAGDILSRLTADAEIVQTAVMDQTLGWVRGLLMSSSTAVLLLYTSWRLALVALTILPPTMLLARRVGRKLRDEHTHTRRLHAKAASLSEQALMCIQTVQQFVNEQYEHRQYSNQLHEAHQAAIQTAKSQARHSAWTQLLGNGSMLCVLAYGGSLIESGQLSPGRLTRFLMYSLILAGNVSGLSTTYMDLMKAVAAANRMLQLINDDNNNDHDPDTLDGNTTINNDNNNHHHHHQSMKHRTDISTPTSERHGAVYNSAPESFPPPLSVEFQNVSFAYPSRPDAPVLHNCSLSIPAGKVVALVGHSGGGKSTVTALLTRLYDAQHGTICLDNQDICSLDKSHVRRQIGIVAQEPLLFATSIRNNIHYGRLDATDSEVQEAARLAHVLDFANRFPDGLDTPVGARGTQLSGGQKQRVAVARCILKAPPIVVFDEATSALDAESEHLVQKAIDTACRGRTVIMIAHRLSTIRNAHKIAVLDDKRVVETGTFNELVHRPKGAFRRLMERQLLEE